MTVVHLNFSCRSSVWHRSQFSIVFMPKLWWSIAFVNKRQTVTHETVHRRGKSNYKGKNRHLYIDLDRFNTNNIFTSVCKQ